MKKTIAMLLALVMLFAMAACGKTADDNAEKSDSPAENGPAVYTYEEDRGDFKVTWELTMYPNGVFYLNEAHGLSGEVTEHSGSTWRENDNGTISTGAWANADVDKSEFFQPNGECTWKLNDDGTCEPVSEGGGSGAATGGISAGKYTYIESKGPGDFQWDVLLMGNGNCRIDETNPSGEVTEHTASGWTDNGDGTVTTGEWENHDVNKSDFFKPNGEATWKINADGTCEPVAEGSGAASAVNPGKYTYTDGGTTWEVKIMGNGTCVVSELNAATGEVIKEHTTRGSADGKGWTDNGDGTFETDEWEPEEREDNKVALASPNGVTTWKVVDAAGSLIEPTEKKETSPVEYGRYLYHDTARDEYWAVMIMGNGSCTIQKVTADGELIKVDGQMLDYPTKGFRLNDDGTFTSFSMEDESNIPEFLSGGENGIATWKIVDAANKVVELVVE